jgi:hypothetical protein
VRGMFNNIKIWQQNRVQKKNLLNLLSEMEKNLEIYYVMDQRQFIIEGYQMEHWHLAKDLDIVKRHENIQMYAKSLLDFNKSHEEYKTFEKWYTSDMNNKTPENAKKLHTLKDFLQHQIKDFEKVIISAGQSLEKELLSLGLIDN